MSQRRKKVAFIASSGGHLEQLLMLRPLMARYDSCLITERTDYKAPSADQKTYHLSQVNRHEALFLPKMIGIACKSLWILLKERPDVVITTGALCVVPLCLMAKVLFGKKLVYIESFARVTSGNITGKFLYRFADRFYVQWESMLKVYPKALYLGGIY
ncbi:MAG: polysaccharide biosynthesis protein [Clostridia bacterium]|nr:polysaccharide biosynthesis protein [Clostridia bacterium]